MLLCGIDEAGRGPLAGPVTAAAVVLDQPGVTEPFPVGLLADSKVLSGTKRAAAARLIQERACLWGIGWASAPEIDQLNILRASHLAMRRALATVLLLAGDHHIHRELIDCVIDGNMAPSLPVPARAVVKADATVPAVMAASILAKEARDRWMIRYALVDERYAFEQHKGYPTELHRERLEAHGPSVIHRYSFRPVQISLSLCDP